VLLPQVRELSAAHRAFVAEHALYDLVKTLQEIQE
jgi:hypothetical protein